MRRDNKKFDEKFNVLLQLEVDTQNISQDLIEKENLTLPQISSLFSSAKSSLHKLWKDIQELKIVAHEQDKERDKDFLLQQVSLHEKEYKA